MKTLSFKIGGMSCASCASSIESEVKKIEGVQKSSVNYAVETGQFEIREDIPEDKVVETIKSLGFTVQIAEASDKSISDDDKIKELFDKGDIK